MESVYSTSQLEKLDLLSPNEEYITRIFGTPTQYLTPHLGIRKIMDENNRYKLDLVIDSETTFDEIEKSFKEILEVRKKIIQIQGHDFCDYLTEILWQLEKGSIVVPMPQSEEIPFLKRMKIKKLTLKFLTLDVNFDALLFFLGSVNLKNDEVFRKFSERLFFELILLFPEKKSESNNVDDIYLERKESWEDNRLFWDIGVYPIPLHRLRNKIRFIRDTRDIFGIRDFSDGSRRRMRQLYILFIKSGDWKISEQFLNKNHPDIYEEYSPRLDMRLKSILEYPFT